ncbi:hypothetical protein EV121DRAFT_273930 [Schizophyllum commune]
MILNARLADSRLFLPLISTAPCVLRDSHSALSVSTYVYGWSMPNPTGKNGHTVYAYPDPSKLLSDFLEWEMEGLTTKEQMARFEKKYSPIKRTKFFALKKASGVETVRKNTMSLPQKVQAILDIKAEDITGQWGVAQVKSRLARRHLFISRDIIRVVLHAYFDHEFDHRFYSIKKKRGPHRTSLRALGPWHQEHADGHEKLAEQALDMGGGVSFPIYGTRDQYTGWLHNLELRPDVRHATNMVHYYLDLVESREYRVSVTMIFDKGTETAEVLKVHRDLRLEAAPDYTVEDWPPTIQLRSVHNTPIEGLWRWKRQGEGLNVRAVLERGRDAGFFNPNDPLAVSTLYWVFCPLIQSRLDAFRDYHNHKRTRFDKTKANPSGVTPRQALECPETMDPPGLDCSITVSTESIQRWRLMYGGEQARQQARRFFSEEFEREANAAYESIGKPEINLTTAWNVYRSILLEIYRRRDVI